jgi:hypothetical protein
MLRTVCLAAAVIPLLLASTVTAFGLLNIDPAVEAIKGESLELSCVADQVNAPNLIPGSVYRMISMYLQLSILIHILRKNWRTQFLIAKGMIFFLPTYICKWL